MPDGEQEDENEVKPTQTNLEQVIRWFPSRLSDDSDEEEIGCRRVVGKSKKKENGIPSRGLGVAAMRMHHIPIASLL